MGAPATLAGVSDLGDWLNETIAADSAEARRAVLCLRLASSLVRSETGRTWLDDQGNLIDPLPDDVQLVTLYCAGRVYDNRDAQTTGGVDDATEGWKVDEAGAYLTASEKRLLAAHRGGGSFRGLGSVSVTRMPDRPNGTGWVPTPTPGIVFPWY